LFTASAERADCLDSQDRQFLPMAVFATVILPAFFLEYNNLSAARLLHDPGAYGNVSHYWTPDCAGIALAYRQHLVESYLGTNIARDPLNHDLVARSDAILFSACLYNRKHVLRARDINPVRSSGSCSNEDSSAP